MTATRHPSRRRGRRAAPALAALALFLGACETTPPEVPASEAAAEAPEFPPQNRPDVRGTTAAVVSDHPLASAAGHAILIGGGNAVDAAVAMAAVLAVVRPHMNGIGGDSFGIFRDGATGEVIALNGSGRAGALADPGFFGMGDSARIPSRGPRSVSVPGTVAAWVDAHERFGSLPLPEVLAPAIGYARDGFPVSTRLQADIRGGRGGLNDAARDLYLPGGEAPEVGALLRNPALATTLEAIANGGKDAFYRGAPARSISALLEAEGGYLREEDFAAHESTWTEPLQLDYLGHTFLAFPPNTQGLTQLQLFGMASHFDVAGMELNGPEYLHTLIELKKIAFADRDAWIGDPDAGTPVSELLDPAYLESRAGLVDPASAADDVESGITRQAAASGGGAPDGASALSATPYSLDPEVVADDGDTIYLTVVDGDGNAVSWIQSLFNTFGSGMLEPESGVMLHNRGALFTLEEGHPNRVAPGKRPFHTLTPLMALRDGELAFTLGTPGGDAQTQSLLQIVHNLLVFGLTPQEALEAPRFRSQGGRGVAIEDRITPEVRIALEALGHDLDVVRGWTATFGGAQMIHVDPLTGALTAAADPRREAYAIAW